MTEDIVVVGDSMLDLYWQGSVQRMATEAPVPVLHVEAEHPRPGGAANLAVNLAALGDRVTLLTLLGTDPAGRRLGALLQSCGVQLDAVRDSRLITTQKIRPVNGSEPLMRVDFEAPPSEAVVNSLGRRLMRQLQRPLWLILSDYAKGSLAPCRNWIGWAIAAGCRVLVDPKGSDFGKYRGAWLLKPNEDELRAVVGNWSRESDFIDRGHALRETLALQHLLVTRGARGMTLFSADHSMLSISGLPCNVVDVCGAGDTAMAALAHFLAAGHGIQDAVRWANRAASLAVGKFGTASVSLAELLRFPEPVPLPVPELAVPHLQLVHNTRAASARLAS